MFDEARSVKGMIEMCALTQGELAKKLGVSQSYVANKLRLLTLDAEEQEYITKEGLSERHARALLRLQNKASRLDVLKRVINGRLTVRETEALVDRLYDGYAEAISSVSDRTEGITTFKDTLRELVKMLRSLGVEVSETTSYYGKKLYLTISLEE